MAIAVQKYIKNMAKSVAYTTSDVLSTKFEYVKDFKEENQEVFKEVYHSIKDYRTTFARVKKTITNNKIMDAARVGYDSVFYSITTGDFYAKNKESEIIEKYGGSLMQGMDIDDDDFDWENQDLSTGDKVIATTIKKNSKIGTALTVEAIAKTGKAQMDVSKENTMLLYTQNERLLNKLDGGFTNIMGFLKQNSEETAKVQNKMNENLNKFMTNVDNNIAKLTKQMDELLEMQRNIYNPSKREEKRKVGYDDIIGRNGVLNIKEYLKQVKKQGFDTINDVSGGMLSQLLGDSMGEGTNLLANFASTPFRMIMEAGVNKALGKSFDNAAKQLNTTLEGIIPSIMAKMNATGKKEDAGIMGFLGKILGIRDKSNESINTSSYNKGAIPFDGITKRAITDVIPYYLRKMTSVLTGEQEMVYDFQSGRWTSMASIKKAHHDTINSANKGTASLITKIIESNMGDRRLSDAYQDKRDYDAMMKAIESLAARLQASGDFGSIKESDLSGTEQEVLKSLKNAMQLSDVNNKDKRFITITENGKKKRISSGRGRSDIGAIAAQLRQLKMSQNNAIKNINEGDSILRLIDAENLAGKDIKDYHGKSYVNNYGDFDQRRIQEMPMSQALIRAKDEYGFTLYQYLRDMGKSLRFIKANSVYLGSLGANDNHNNDGSSDNPQKIAERILSGSGDIIDYGRSKDDKYIETYYQRVSSDNEKKENDKWIEKVNNAIKKAAEKGKSYTLATTTDFESSDDKIGLRRIMAEADQERESKAILEYQKEQEKAKNEKWKKIEEFLGKDETRKLREVSDKFDSTKTLKENMEKAKDQGFAANLMMFSKVIQSKIDNPVNSASDALLKVDYWLQNLIYGEDLKEDERKKSLFDRMKGEFQRGFQWVQKKLDDSFDWIKKKMEPIFKPFKKIGEFFLGGKDEDGVYTTGVLAPFIGGVQKGLRKNAKDVKEYIRQEKEEAARKLRAMGVLSESSDEESDSSSSSSSSRPKSTVTQVLTQEQKDALRLKINNDIYTGDKTAISPTKNKNQSSNNKITDYNDIMLAEKSKKLNKRIKNIKIDIGKLKAERTKYKKELQELIPIYESYTAYKQQPPEDLVNRKAQLERKILEIETQIADKETELDNLQKYGLGKHNKKQSRNNELKTQINDIESRIAELNTSGGNSSNLEQELQNLRSQSAKLMFAGGINKTGSPFKSVLSAGELHNGKIVPRTGIYNINPGDTVVNPAPPSIRSKQAQNERRYLANIRRNANANDGLQNQNNNDQQEDVNKIAELMTNRDWNTLTDNKQRAEFLGSVASRGLIGGGLGLLVGGPLLGAAVGAASSLTKSTDAFSSLLFGNAIKDKNGEIKVDDNGNIIRSDDGLISQEIMKAMPDVKRLGIGGAIAGLVTPLGPLGGILAGSALGFAKNAEIFQGSLFGDGGIFSDKNINKLKKGAKNMGIGAAATALLTPIGPFGLIGNALVGATAGYITSTDKFKDAILGERKDPNDPNSEREGGIVNAIKSELRPFKDFGLHLRDRVMDEIFGKKNGDDKREGGIFGAIRENVVEPLIQGGKSVFHELKNKASDLAHLMGDIYKKIRDRMAGNDLLGSIIQTADKITGGILGGAGKAIKLATTPFRLIGDDGIGGWLAAKRIQKGEEHNMTARERLAFRGKRGISADDNYSESDKAMAKMSQDDLLYAQSLLSYNENQGDVDKEKNKYYDIFGQNLRETLNRKDSKKIIKLIKQGKYAEAEKIVRTSKVSDEAKAKAKNLISNQKNKLSKIEDAYSKIEESGKTTQDLLRDLGLNVDVNDPKSIRYLNKQLKRELAHTESGLTDEEIEWEKEREFWTNEKSPLNTVNNATSNIQKILENIYRDLSYGKEYDNMSDEEKAKYGSRKEYIDSKRSIVAENAIKTKTSAEYTFTQTKIGKLNAKSKRNNKLIFDDIVDLSMYNDQNFEDVANPDNNLNEVRKDINEIIDRACQIFDSKVLEQLANKNAIISDIDEAAKKIMRRSNVDEETAKKQAIDKLTRSNIIIVEGDMTYTIPKLTYSAKENCITPLVTRTQQQAYDIEKQKYVKTYVKNHTPKKITDMYLSMESMIGKSIKLASYLRPTRLPFVILEYIFNSKPIKVVKNAIEKVIRKGLFEANIILGDHDIDNESIVQKIINDKYQKEAENEWKKEYNLYMTEFQKLSLGRRLRERQIANNGVFEFLNKLCEEIDGLPTTIFGDLSKEDQLKVKEKFIAKYIQAKKDKQVFGHGMIGNVKKAISNVKDKIKSTINTVKSFGKIIFGANGDVKDAKRRFMEKKRKEAEKKWIEIFKERSEGNTEKYDTLLVPILAKYFGNVPFEKLDEKSQEKLKDLFIQKYCNDEYNYLLYGRPTKLETKVLNGIIKLNNSFVEKYNKFSNRIKNNRRKDKANKLAKRMIRKEYVKFNTIAQEKFQKDYRDLTDDEKQIVNLEYFDRYTQDGGIIGEIGRDINTSIVNAKKKATHTMGTIKSGVKNSVAGKLDKVRQYKERQQAEDTFIGKFFDKLDGFRMKHEREKIEGKRDSRLAKILKWLFVGGIAAPILVGFVKEKIMPAIHEKIQPWLKKAGEKLIGVKDPQTGEYKDGLVSGIVNPIRNFFKDKFQNVHDWFANEGKYSDERTGMKGLLNNLKGIGNYIIELWKSGSATMYGEWLPKIVEGIGERAIPMLGCLLKGVGKFIVKSLKGEVDPDTVKTDFSPVTKNRSISTKGMNTTLNTGFGGTVSLSVPSSSKSLSFQGMNINTDSMFTKSTNPDGTVTISTQISKNSVTTETIKSRNIKSLGKDENGVNIYSNKKNPNEKYIKDKNGNYIPLSQTTGTSERISDNEIHSLGTNSNGVEVFARNDEDNTKYIKDDETGAYFKLTDKSITSENINPNDMYYVGNNQDGIEMYVKNGTNTKYIKEPETGTFIPMTEYQQFANEKLENNRYLQEYSDKEKDNKLQAGYSVGDSNNFVANGAATAFGKLLFHRNNIRILGGDKLSRALASFSRGAAESTNILKAGGVAGDIVNNAAKFFSSATTKISDITTPLQEKGYKLIDKISGGTFTKIGEAQAAKASKAASQKQIDKALKKLLIQDKLDTAREKVVTKVTQSAGDIAYNIERKGGLGAKILEVVRSLKGKLSDAINKILKNPKVSKVLKKAVVEHSDDIAKGIEKGVLETVENGAETIAKRGAALGVKTIAKAVPIISVIADFLLGMDNCRNILGIVSENPTFMERLCGGIINMIPSLIMSLADIVAVGTGGLAVPIAVIMYVLSIIGMVLMSFEPMRNKLIGIVIDVLDAIPGINMDDIKQKRQEAQEAVAAYNQKNGTSLNMEEYNNLIGNKTIATKTKEGIVDKWSATFGYDSASKKDILSSTENTIGSNKYSEKVRKKLATIFSSIWQFYGESDFNYSKAVDKDDNELKGKDKLNANQLKFTQISSLIISDLITLLNSQDESIAQEVSSNVTDFTGPIDSSIHLKNVYKSGKKDPTTQFNIDEEHADWKRIKAIAGVCAIINEIFEPIGQKEQVTAIIVSKMVPAYFTSEESEVAEWANNQSSMYNLDMSQYDSSNLLNPNYYSESEASDIIATNANANDKLSPLKRSKGFNNLEDMIINTINTSLANITGNGFTGIGEIIEGLKNKNVAINRKIDSLKLLPTDDEYWNIQLDDNNPFASSLFKFTESISRVIKAPFSLAASMNASTAQIVSDSASQQSTSASSSSSPTGGDATSGSSNSNVFTKIGNVAKKLWSGFKSIFGKGKGDSDSSDPYHIYQRDFKQSYNINGDSEYQSVADSGCGPASAASILRMYGKEGNMNNAVNYALKNKYKEKNGGTYPQFFQDYLGKNGIATNSNASNVDVINSLAQNKPVILMGQNKTGSKNTPYGSKYSHYVVARGFDKNGNVIVEDSEDKRGSTRYSLADTLRNTSIRITTGKGTYGRGANDMSINERYITNVNNAISASVASVIASAISGANIGGSNTSNSNNIISNSGATVTGTATFNIDSDDTIICGDSITHGLSSTSLKERALGQGSGTTDKTKVTDAGSYETIFKAHSDVIAKAKNVIFFWGMNEVNTKQSPDAYFAQYQDSIDTILGYAGKSTADTNVCIMTVIWVPENSGYGGSYNAAKVEAFNDKYIKAFASSKGYPLIDIYEDSKQVPHNAGDVHPSNYQVLYEIIKKHTSGGTIANDTNSSSGSGRGKRIIEKSKNYNKYGKGIWGRDGSEESTTTPETTDQTTSDSNTTTDTSSEETTTTTTTSNGSSSTSNATGLLSLLGSYSKALTKGIFGNFYDALYGVEQEQNQNTGFVGTGDAAKMLGKKLTMSRSGGLNGSTYTLTIAITEDEVELYNMLTAECGLNAACACGVLGNWEEENGINSIKTTATKGIIYYGGGIMQWTDSGAGNPHLNWIKSHPEYASDPWSWEANKAHAKEEIINGDANWKNCTKANPSLESKGFKPVTNMEEFKQLTNPEDAAVNYERAFEVSFNWNGKTTENAVLPAEKYYDNNRALEARILYELIVNGKCDEEGGAGRGRAKSENENWFPQPRETSKYVNGSYIKKLKKNTKFGKGIWGRADSDNESTENIIESTQENVSNNTQQEVINEETSTTNPSNTNNPQSKYLISKLTSYAKAGVKGVFGKFYDALYGSEPETANNNIGQSFNNGPVTTCVPYSIYRYWKQASSSCAAFADKYTDTWSNLPIYGSTVGNVGCLLVSMALLLVHSGSVQESDFSPEKYIKYATSKGWTSGGMCSDASQLGMYNDQQLMTQVDYQKNAFGPDYTGTASWDTIYNTILSEMQAGKYVVMRVNWKSGMHFCAVAYVDTAGKEIYIMDPATRDNSYKKLSRYLYSKDDPSVSKNRILGYRTFTTSASSASSYVLNGVLSEDSDVAGSGRGNINYNTDIFNNNRISDIDTELPNISDRNNILSGKGKSNQINARTLSGLTTVNNSTRRNAVLSSNMSYNHSSSRSNTNNGTKYYSTSSSSNGSYNNNTIDLGQVINLISIIANNADKMDAVLQLLGTIAVNTENTTTAVNNRNNNSSNKNKNGLAALRNAIDSGGSGMDIVNAVYQIAKS